MQGVTQDNVLVIESLKEKVKTSEENIENANKLTKNIQEELLKKDAELKKSRESELNEIIQNEKNKIEVEQLQTMITVKDNEISDLKSQEMIRNERYY